MAAKKAVHMKRKASWQDVWANIWSAVLAVGSPVVNVVIVWLGPEVLLSLLPKTTADYTLLLILGFSGGLTSANIEFSDLALF